MDIDLEAQRTRFEKLCAESFEGANQSRDRLFVRRDDGEYMIFSVQERWQGWLMAMSATPAPAAEGELPGERTLFEQSEQGTDFARAFSFGTSPDDYANPHLQNRWIGWQRRAAIAADRASRDQQPAGAQGVPVYQFRQKRDGCKWLECEADTEATMRNSPVHACFEFRTLYAVPTLPSVPDDRLANVVHTLQITDNWDRLNKAQIIARIREVDAELASRCRAQGGNTSEELESNSVDSQNSSDLANNGHAHMMRSMGGERIDTPEFRELAMNYRDAGILYANLIAHINAWGDAKLAQARADLAERLHRAETVLRMAGFEGDSATGWKRAAGAGLEGPQPFGSMLDRFAKNPTELNKTIVLTCINNLAKIASERAAGAAGGSVEGIDLDKRDFIGEAAAKLCGLTEDSILDTILMFRRAGEGTPFGAETAQRCARVIFGNVQRALAASRRASGAGEKEVTDAVVNWWVSQKPFGYSIEEYLERPDNWVSGTSKLLARLAAKLYRASTTTEAAEGQTGNDTGAGGEA